MAVTIKDISRETGLAISTISKYLNNGSVRPENREKIAAAIKKLGFVPNFSARRLRGVRTYMIGVLTGEAKSPFTSALLSEIEKKMQEAGYTLIPASQDFVEGSEEKVLDYMLTRGIDGFLVWPSWVTGKDFYGRLKSEGIPVVLLEENWIGCPFDCIQVNCSMASYQLTEYLLKRGHKKIGIITGNMRSTTAKERLAGYERAFEDYCVPIDRDYQVCGQFTFEGGYNALRQLWKMEEKPTAIYACNYNMAQGMMAAIAELKIRVPEDLSVVVFDDFELSYMVHPALTAIRQPVREMADRACDLLIERIEQEISTERKVIRLPAEIEWRESVREIEE